MAEPGLKLPLTKKGATVALGNRMVHPIGSTTDKSASGTRTCAATTGSTATSPSVPALDNDRIVG